MNGRRIILGMGSGRCGTNSLAALLDQQKDTRATHEEPPLLPWSKYAAGPGIAERLERICRQRSEAVVADVASFYLPYAEQAIAAAPDIRIVCLRRPRREVIASFCRWSDKVHPLPTNHWSREPAAPWYHEPIWSTIFPKYDTQDRPEAIGQYWDEYDQTARELVERFPDNVRIFEAQQALNSPQGQSELLSFCGYHQDQQVHDVGLHTNRTDRAAERHAPAGSSTDPDDRRRCVVLVPYSGHIVDRCERALVELQRRGYPVRRVSGYANVDLARSQMATDALIRGFEETMWIDADVAFHPDDVDRLRSHRLPICSGVYAKKGKRELACHVMPGTSQLVFGKEGGLCELLYAATGFLHVRREVYQAMQCQLPLPVCNQQFGRPLIPFFQPLWHAWDDGQWYMTEDYSFCHRARQCGYKIMADTRIRLWHVGSYAFSWEDAGVQRDRFASFTLKLQPDAATADGAAAEGAAAEGDDSPPAP